MAQVSRMSKQRTVFRENMRWDRQRVIGRTYAVPPVNATGATAGSPGSFTPVESIPPADLDALAGVTATPATAWTTGQYVVLGDGSHAHWTGTAWAAGDAT